MAAIYTTVEKIYEQASRIGSATNITSSEIANQIIFQESIVNAKIAQRYSVPFAAGSVPPVIETITADLATWRILRSSAYKDASERGEWLKLYKESMDLLTEIASGTMILVNSDGSNVAQATNVRPLDSTTKNFKPVFDLRDSTDWRVDPDLIDAENDAAL